MNLLETVEFLIVVEGDRTGEKWTGNFTALRRLSHRQELLRDRIYRELLGANPETASERAKSQAEIIADLKVCLVKTPEWWKNSGDGLDLADDNLIQELWKETIRIRVDAINEVKKAGEDATEKLKKLAAEEAANK